jgi:hypothetical protein
MGGRGGTGEVVCRVQAQRVFEAPQRGCVVAAAQRGLGPLEGDLRFGGEWGGAAIVLNRRQPAATRKDFRSDIDQGGNRGAAQWQRRRGLPARPPPATAARGGSAWACSSAAEVSPRARQRIF